MSIEIQNPDVGNEMRQVMTYISDELTAHAVHLYQKGLEEGRCAATQEIRKKLNVASANAKNPNLSDRQFREKTAMLIKELIAQEKH